MNLPAEGGERESIEETAKKVGFELMNDSDSDSEYVSSSYWSDDSRSRKKSERGDKSLRNTGSNFKDNKTLVSEVQLEEKSIKLGPNGEILSEKFKPIPIVRAGG